MNGRPSPPKSVVLKEGKERRGGLHNKGRSKLRGDLQGKQSVFGKEDRHFPPHLFLNERGEGADRQAWRGKGKWHEEHKED